MTYTFSKEELIEFKAKMIGNTNDFITNVLSFKEKNFPLPDPSGWPAVSSNDRVITINLKKFVELVETLRQDITKTIEKL